jgi:hypothetical protein
MGRIGLGKRLACHGRQVQRAAKAGDKPDDRAGQGAQDGWVAASKAGRTAGRGEDGWSGNCRPDNSGLENSGAGRTGSENLGPATGSRQQSRRQKTEKKKPEI